MTLAQTLTAAAGAVADSPRAQIAAALVGLALAVIAGLAVMAPTLLAGLRSWVGQWAAKRQLEELRMQRDLEKLRASEAQALTSTVIRGVEAISDEDTRKRTKGAIKAMAEEAGVEPTLNAAVKEVTNGEPKP